MSINKKRINKLGMMDVVDNIRLVSKDITDAVSNWNPPVDDTSFEVKFKLIEISKKLEDWLGDFNNDTEWDVRDDSDSFDTIN
jgi:hypothetical protein